MSTNSPPRSPALVGESYAKRDTQKPDYSPASTSLKQNAEMEDGSGQRLPLKKGASDRSTVRVGVAEVGSRGIRILIADVSEREGLVPCHKDSISIGLMAAVTNGRPNESLEVVDRVLTDFKEKAAELQVDKISIIGTEAVRTLMEQPEYRTLPVLRQIEVLDRREEAYCSFISAARGLPRLKSARVPVLVIDQGSGSVELALGHASPPFELLGFASLRLGADALMRRHSAVDGDLLGLLRWIQAQIDKVDLPTNGSCGVVVQGSVATKCAWDLVRRGPEDRYSPWRVHGIVVESRALRKKIMTEATKRLPDWEPEQLAGAMVLLGMINHFKASSVIVSAYATRYGRAWQLIEQTPSAR